MTDSGNLQRGATLIELLLYVSIVGFVLLAATAWFGLSIEARVKNQSIMEVDQQGMYAMDYITSTVRSAQALTAPAAGTSDSRMSLTMAAAGASPTVISLNGQALQVKEGSGQVTPLTSDAVKITNVSLHNLSPPNTPGVMQISFTISRASNSTRNEYNYSKVFTTTAALRRQQ